MASAVEGLVPKPVHTESTGSQFTAGAELTVAADESVAGPVAPWARAVSAAYGVLINVVVGQSESARMQVRSDPSLPAGGYELNVASAEIRLQARDAGGVSAGLASLRQLMGPQAYRSAGSVHSLIVDGARIVDHPGFSWRGVLLDVARHFLPKRDVLRFIDQAADLKLNRLQLHLADDQGWRVEIKRYPRLTEAGGWRPRSGIGTWRAGREDATPHGGYYTQDELREICTYAHERGIAVIPEIDVPGHSEAAIAAYPMLGMGKEEARVRTRWGISTNILFPGAEQLEFYRGVFDEILEVFDSPWISLGGDEVPHQIWREDPRTVELAAELGLSSTDDLHGYFIARLSDQVIDAGRRPVVWDEALSEQLPKEVIITAWRGGDHPARALAAGHDVILAPEEEIYLDHRASADPHEPAPVGFVRSLADVYAYSPGRAAAGFYGLAAAQSQTRTQSQTSMQAQHPTRGLVLGAQAEVWTEHLPDSRRVDYATHPRLAAFAERVWRPGPIEAAGAQNSPGEPEDSYAEFERRLTDFHLPRLDAAGVEYRPLAGPHPWQERPDIPGHLRDLAAERAARADAAATQPPATIEPSATTQGEHS